jgi:hypothetical protein
LPAVPAGIRSSSRKQLGLTAGLHESCVYLHGLFADQTSTRPPPGDGGADGRSIVFLDEVDAGADVLDLEGCYVMQAPLDCRRPASSHS